MLLEIAPDLSLSGQLVLQLLVRGLHHDVDGVAGIVVGPRAGFHVHELVAFLPYRVQAELLFRNREGESTIIGVHQHGSAAFHRDHGTFQALSRHKLTIHHAAFGLHVALLGLGGKHEAYHQNRKENKRFFHGCSCCVICCYPAFKQ